tara:strand:- start:619 stop:756 length:138 start_codon:yes stop_codon:yes gene_type:complete
MRRYRKEPEEDENMKGCATAFAVTLAFLFSYHLFKIINHLIKLWL